MRSHPIKMLGCTAVGFAALGLLFMAMAPQRAPSSASMAVKIETRESIGSGFHIGKGLFVTAAHVVGDSAGVTVKLDTGKTTDGEVLWQNRAYDVALVRAKNAIGAAVGRLACGAVNVGDPVQAIGNPAHLEFVHSHGRIAARAEQRAMWKSVFIADMTVSGGMSGGPVLNSAGDVVGVTVGVYRMAAWAFIVPASVVCDLLGR